MVWMRRTLWVFVLGVGVCAGAFWLYLPERRPEARALLSLFLLLYLNAAIQELLWRRSCRKASVSWADLKEICQSASQADPVSVFHLVDHLCAGTPAEKRFALIALRNIGVSALGFLVVRCELAGEPSQSDLRRILGKLTGKNFCTRDSVTRWWMARREAYQHHALDTPT